MIISVVGACRSLRSSHRFVAYASRQKMWPLIRRRTGVLPSVNAEAYFALCLSLGLVFLIFQLFLLQPTYSATMVEYVIKFLPALTDTGFYGIFDFNGMGDPRPRVISSLFTFLNIALRRE